LARSHKYLEHQGLIGMARESQSLAVLVSGGIDSAVLVAESREQYPSVYPVYVRTGVVWEAAELEHLSRYLSAISHPRLCPLVELSLPMADLYEAHWSITGVDVPDERSPDEAVYLPGWNVALLSKALIWCHLHGVGELAIAPLSGNPFPDATGEFFASLAGVVGSAVGGHVQIRSPYVGLKKAQVMRRGRDLPLELTFSCLSPRGGAHCGRCNKCGERQKAFRDAALPDPTRYGSGT
jgi:7-cyano-7-deazaguanine synthase